MAQLRDLSVNGSARVIGDLYADLSGNVLNYGLCFTAAATAAKVVNTTGPFNLIDGSKILVLFQNSNTANSPTLNVNNTGAKAIFVDESNGIPKNFIVGQQYYWFVYNAARDHWRVASGGTTQITAIQYGGTNNDGFTSNRPLFFNGTKIIGSTTNYINDTALAINKTSITSGYNFEVNGKSLFNNSVVITATTDIGGTTANKAPLSIGSLTGEHIEIDGNEILAKTNNTTAGTLYLQDGSGYVKVAGSGLGIGGENTSYKLYVNGTSLFEGNATHNGIVYFANGTTYYINNSADGELKDLNVHTLGVRTHPGAGEGISLQGGYNSTGFADFGIAYADTGNGGKYGDVQADWATYFTIKRESKPQRGWIWRGDNADTAATMAASLSNRGVFTTRAVAADNTYIAFPEGGTYSATGDTTGILVIKLPSSQKGTTLRFDVKIYTNIEGKKTLATYHIGGQDGLSTNGWEHGQVYAEGIGTLSNLTVRLGIDNSDAIYVTIGEINTIWNNPEIVITDLIIGNTGNTIENWAYGWQVSIQNANPLTSTAFIFNKPNIEIEFTGMNLLPNTQYMEGWSGDDYAGMDLPEKYCRAKRISLPGSSTSTLSAEISYTEAFAPEPSTWYTLSFWIKSNLSGDVLTQFVTNDVYEIYNSDNKTGLTNGAIIFTLPENTWKRCWVTWKTSSNIDGLKTVNLVKVLQVTNTKIVTICLPKLEKGRIPSDWTRNPLDVVHLYGSGGDSSYIQSGGGFVNNENNLILHGNLNTGTSGIVFAAQKGNINTVVDTSNNFDITDRAFIQYHPYGVNFGNEGNEISSKSEKETGAFVIGIGDNASTDVDKEDILYLQAPGDLAIKHVIKDGTAHTIADTNNTNWYTTWNNGTSLGPTLDLVMAGIVKTTPAIPVASDTISGVVNTIAQTFKGDKTFYGHIYTQTNSTYDIGSSSKKFRNIYAITYYGTLQHSVTFERNSVTLGSFDNSASVSYNFGSVVQDLTGSTTGTANNINAATFDGMTKQQWLNTIYPVGSIYMSVNSTSPATLFGGTWEQLENRFLLGAGSSYTSGSTGGSATMAHTHSVTASGTVGNTTLTIAQIPAHNHAIDAMSWPQNASAAEHGPNNWGTSSWPKVEAASIANTGGGQPHNHGFTGSAVTSGGASNTDNMPPYLVVYMWKRTA